jgi:hypothetical protein
MIYTAVRLGFDVIYWVGRLTFDGTYYMIYGHQETQQEKMETHIKMLEMKFEEKSLKERENNKILVKLAKQNGFTIKDFETELDSDTILLT